MVTTITDVFSVKYLFKLNSSQLFCAILKYNQSTAALVILKKFSEFNLLPIHCEVLELGD